MVRRPGWSPRVGGAVDHDQHVVQDSAEHYAVYVMQKAAEELGVASTQASSELEARFMEYMRVARLSMADFETGEYGQYKRNVDLQVPQFVVRLSEHFDHEPMHFENVEKEFRNQGLKGDFLVGVAGH